MAKLKGPLFSLGATQQLGKTLVYFAWKGIDVVREYVVPANPQSTAQIAQRIIFRDAVANWHAFLHTAADVIAWNRYAGTLAKTMSGFNAFMRLRILALIAVIPWAKVSDVQVDTPTANGFDVDVENSTAGQTFRAAIGTSKTFFPTRVALNDDADNTYSLTWAAGQSEIQYFVKIEEQQGGVWYQRSGIYQITTS